MFRPTSRFFLVVLVWSFYRLLFFSVMNLFATSIELYRRKLWVLRNPKHEATGRFLCILWWAAGGCEVVKLVDA